MEDTKLFEAAVFLCIDAYRQTKKKNLLKKILKGKNRLILLNDIIIINSMIKRF